MPQPSAPMDAGQPSAPMETGHALDAMPEDLRVRTLWVLKKTEEQVNLTVEALDNGHKFYRWCVQQLHQIASDPRLPTASMEMLLQTVRELQEAHCESGWSGMDNGAMTRQLGASVVRVQDHGLSMGGKGKGKGVPLDGPNGPKWIADQRGWCSGFKIFIGDLPRDIGPADIAPFVPGQTDIAINNLRSRTHNEPKTQAVQV